jgi:hypothetical protein
MEEEYASDMTLATLSLAKNLSTSALALEDDGQGMLRVI